MKSIVIEDVKKFSLKEVEEPTKEDGKVLIKVMKTGICGSDIHYWDLGNPKGLVMGHEYAGIVLDTGGREDLQIGDRVTALPLSPCGKCAACLKGDINYCPETWLHASGLSLDNPGGLAPLLKVRCDMVFKLPDNMSDEEGALVEPTAVGLHAIKLANISVGDNVLVVGGGIIGLVSAMFAKKSGASKVVITETNIERGKLAVSLGVADSYINALDEEEVKNNINKFDKVIECSGNSSAVNSALNFVIPSGKVVLVGVSMLPINYQSILHVMKELTVVGAIAYTKSEFKKCIDMIANKEIDVLKFVSKTVTLEDVQKSYEELTSKDNKSIKILIDPQK